MLPPATQDRILDAIPTTFPIHHTKPGGNEIRYNWESKTSWYNEDIDIEGDQRPEIIIQPTTEGHLRVSDQPIGDFIRSLENDDPAVAYDKLRGKRLYDEWSFTVVDDGSVAVDDESGSSAGVVTARDRVEGCIFNLKQYFWFEATDELYNYGAHGREIPVRPRLLTGGGDTSEMVDQANYSRRNFTLRLLYTLTYETAVDAVDRIRGDVDIGGTFDVDA